ncbi:putative pyridoxine biosynthesis protein [Neoconidiobolus thromboides FSU 785]|nr:putative pyridoxine biosynthesis protein [Neoconidiobolus thromboides FSU 785]
MVNFQHTIGVLALQGAFEEHIDIINQLGDIKAVAVRTEAQLQNVDALILPGGESTAMALIAERNQLFEPLRQFVKTKPVWGTCAGLILLADEANQVKKGGQELIGGLHITVNRNQFGSQVQSFEADLEVPCLAQVSKVKGSNSPYRCMFIRAPVILEVDRKEGVEVLSTIDYHNQYTEEGKALGIKEFIVAVQQKHILGTSFHPELTKDYRWHQYFVKMVKEFYTAK